MTSYREDSEVAICNQALGLIEHPGIASLDQPHNAAARNCRIFYANTRDRLLADYRWNFNTERGTFANVAAPAHGYSHAYQRPGDCLRVLEVDGCASRDWIVEGERLLIDRAPPLRVRWLKRVTDPRFYTAHFVDLLAHEIALRIAGPLARRRAIKQDVLDRLEDLRAAATSADAREGRETLVEFRSSFLEARRI